MQTERPPRKPELKEEFERSEQLRELKLPPAAALRQLAAELEIDLKREDRGQIEKICNRIAATVAASYGVAAPPVKVLGARPLKQDGDWVDETFGDYSFDSARIRLWMRTAVLEKVTSYGTFLSTLCHEICHHLDVVHFDLPHTYHTLGFYERAGMLYHHVRGTPMRKLVWDKQNNGCYRINWPATMRGVPVVR
jgi:hypothetical protein